MKFLFYIVTFLCIPNLAQSQDYFVPLEGPFGAKFSPLCFDSSGYLYSVDHKNKVIRSVDNGDTWELFHDGIENYSIILDIQAAPNGNVALATHNKIYLLKNGETVWKPFQLLPTSFNGFVKIAFNEYSRLHVAINKIGILRDTTWGPQQFFLPIFQNNNFYCEKLGFFGNDNNFALGYIYGGGGNVVLKISENGNVQDISPSQYIDDTKDLLFFDQGYLLIAASNGLWKYDYFDQEWSQLIIDSSTQIVLTNFVPLSDNEFYIIGEPDNYHSADYGNTFTKVTEAPFSLISETCLYCPTFEYNDYPVNSFTRSKDGVLLFSNAHKNQTLLRSFDFGQHWDYIDLQYKLPIVTSTVKDSSGNLFAQTLGINRTEMSQDDGATWGPVLIGENNSMTKLIVDENSNFIYAINNKEIVFRSEDNGNTWDTISNGFNPPILEWRFSISPKGNIYLYDRHSLFGSDDKGDSWIFLDSIQLSSNIDWHPDGSMYAFEGSNLVKSIDNGHTWTKEDFIVNFPIFVPFVELHITNQGHFFGKGYYHSINMDPGDIYLNFISKNGENEFSPLPDTGRTGQITSNSCGDIIVNSHYNVFISNDTAETWVDISAGVLPNQLINHIYVDKEDYLYLSLKRDVVYKSILPTCKIPQPPSAIFESGGNLVSSKISPNPFKNSFKLEIENNFNHHLKLQLISQSGINMLEKEFSGNTLEIKRNNLPNGIYYYHIYLGEKMISTGKVIAQ